MNIGNVILDARVAHVRELKAETARLKAELAAVRNGKEAVEKHFSLALAALRDADSADVLVAIDGWNAVNRSPFRTREALLDYCRSIVRPGLFIWIVFDGDEAAAETSEGLRVSYTGGTGDHRADRLISDWVHAFALRGLRKTVRVVTDDDDFAKKTRQYGAEVYSCSDLRRAFGPVSA